MSMRELYLLPSNNSNISEWNCDVSAADASRDAVMCILGSYPSACIGTAAEAVCSSPARDA